MFDKTDKRRLYALIDCYLLNEIDLEDFCSRYKDIFVFDIPYDALADFEQSVFTHLGVRVNRVLEDPGLLANPIERKQLSSEINEVKHLLIYHENILYNSNDKNKLYWLINQYLLKKIDASTFCDKFYYCFDLELDYKTLTSLEESIFLELSTVAGRFSPFKEDIKKYPGTYFTEQELHDVVVKAKKTLSSKDLIC